LRLDGAHKVAAQAGVSAPVYRVPFWNAWPRDTSVAADPMTAIFSGH
jgi:hypothetical protein